MSGLGSSRSVVAATLALGLAVLVSGCGGSAATPRTIYITPAPATSPTPIETRHITPAASPTQTPVPTPVAPTHSYQALQKIACLDFDGQEGAIVAGGSIFIACGDVGPLLSAYDGTTGKLSGRYPNIGAGTIGFSGKPLAVDHGIWYTVLYHGGCSHFPCFTDIRIYMADQKTGQDVFNVPGWELADAGLGYAWGFPSSDGTDVVIKIDVLTHRHSQIPWSYGGLQVACGNLWGLSERSVTRVDPANGEALASFALPDLPKSLADLGGLADIGGRCWVPTSDGFARLGDDGIDFRTSAIPGTPMILGQSFWMTTTGSTRTLMRRIDPRTWQPVGDNWVQPARRVHEYGRDGSFDIGDEACLMAASNSIWLLTGIDHNEYLHLIRTNIPNGPLP
jgi:hypothetical protein